VGVALAPHRVGPLVLPPGRSELTLESRGPATTPRSLDPSNIDERPLAIFLGEWAMADAPPPDAEPDGRTRPRLIEG
jgi:hypothetical protein